MKNILNDKTLIENVEESLGGVFSFADIACLLGEPHSNQLYRRVRALEAANILSRFKKGIYITQNFSLKILSQRLCDYSYVSFSTVLSENQIIGIRPMYILDAVKIGTKRTYTNNKIKIRHFSCAKHLYFGFRKIDGINIADKEKSFLDTLYYYQHGVKFPFDIYSDINLHRLDIKLIEKYLKEYKNPKYIKFVEEYINEHS